MSEPLTAGKLYEIVETEEFRKKLGAIEPDSRRSDEFLWAVTWALAKNPKNGEKLPRESDVWGKPVNEHANVPTMVVYYTFSGEQVFLLGIELFTAPDNG